MAQPTKADFGLFVQFTPNFDTRLLDFQVRNALDLDIRPLLGDKLYRAIKSLAPFTYAEWTHTGTFPADSYVSHEDAIYRVVVEAVGSEPAAENGDYSAEELKTFYAFYLLPYWILTAYINILHEAGRNLTQYGLVTPIESSNASQPISRDDRADLIKHYTMRKEQRRAQLGAYLASVGYVLDDVSYAPESVGCESRRHVRDIGIRAVRKKRHSCGCWGECCCDDNYRYRPPATSGNNTTTDGFILLE